MKSISLFICILAMALLVSATEASPLTFFSPVSLCPPGETRPDCLPWRPTPPVTFASPLAAPMRQSDRDQSPAIQPVMLPATGGGAPGGWLFPGAILLVGIGILLLARRRRDVVRVNLVALIRQATPQMWGADERMILERWLAGNHTEPGQMVTIDLSKCAEK